MPATGFWQTRPDEGQPATEETEVYVVYDDDPDAIVVAGNRRDDSLVETLGPAPGSSSPPTAAARPLAPGRRPGLLRQRPRPLGRVARDRGGASSRPTAAGRHARLGHPPGLRRRNIRRPATVPHRTTHHPVGLSQPLRDTRVDPRSGGCGEAAPYRRERARPTAAAADLSLPRSAPGRGRCR